MKNNRNVEVKIESRKKEHKQRNGSKMVTIIVHGGRDNEFDERKDYVLFNV